MAISRPQMKGIAMFKLVSMSKDEVYNCVRDLIRFLPDKNERKDYQLVAHDALMVASGKDDTQAPELGFNTLNEVWIELVNEMESIGLSKGSKINQVIPQLTYEWENSTWTYEKEIATHNPCTSNGEYGDCNCSHCVSRRSVSWQPFSEDTNLCNHSNNPFLV